MGGGEEEGGGHLEHLVKSNKQGEVVGNFDKIKRKGLFVNEIQL